MVITGTYPVPAEREAGPSSQPQCKQPWHSKKLCYATWFLLLWSGSSPTDQSLSIITVLISTFLKSAMYGFQEQLCPLIKGEQSQSDVFFLRVSVGKLMWQTGTASMYNYYFSRPFLHSSATPIYLVNSIKHTNIITLSWDSLESWSEHTEQRYKREVNVSSH